MRKQYFEFVNVTFAGLTEANCLFFVHFHLKIDGIALTKVKESKAPQRNMIKGTKIARSHETRIYVSRRKWFSE